MINTKGFINIAVVIGIFVVALLAGGFILSRQNVDVSPPPPGVPASASFGTSLTMRVNGQIKFNDGLVVTLAEINDSRCKDGVVCIWAGELSPRFVLLGGNITEVKGVILGTTTQKSATQNGYTITLNNATETTATITVTKAVVTNPPPPPPAPQPVACTMEAKLCPDGSYVGRTGPKCEFAACPANTGTTVNLREGERNGPLLVQKIYPTYITGLVYREYPIATSDGQPITMYIGDEASNGCTETLTLIKIQGSVATFNKKTDYNRPCPICLAEGTLIDTPVGKIAVQDLKVGMPVWTTDLSGARVVGQILLASKTPVPIGHQVVHLVLGDGRELYVSPLHPTVDGRVVGILKAGDMLNGARIKVAELVPYSKKFTYDILPSGGTGAYFANGILMGSTLNK